MSALDEFAKDAEKYRKDAEKYRKAADRQAQIAKWAAIVVAITLLAYVIVAAAALYGRAV